MENVKSEVPERDLKHLNKHVQFFALILLQHRSMRCKKENNAEVNAFKLIVGNLDKPIYDFIIIIQSTFVFFLKLIHAGIRVWSKYNLS